MNEPDQTTPPPLINAKPEMADLPEIVPASPPKPLKWWLKKLFACNPFYLVSAALLLYGCYRASPSMHRC